MIAFQKISSCQSIIAMARSAFVHADRRRTVRLAKRASPAAQSTSVPIVRDAEIEALVTDYATPIIKTAGLSKRRSGSFWSTTTASMPSSMAGGFSSIRVPCSRPRRPMKSSAFSRMRRAILPAVTNSSFANNWPMPRPWLLLPACSVWAPWSVAPQAAPGRAVESWHGRRHGRPRSRHAQPPQLSALGRNGGGPFRHYLSCKHGTIGQGHAHDVRALFQCARIDGNRVDPYRISHPMPRERIANLETLAHASPYYRQAGQSCAAATP